MDVRIEDEGRVLRLGETRFHAIWLLDNAQDADTRDPGNGQRLITMADLPDDPRLTGARVADGGVALEIAGRVLHFAPDWLLAHAYDRPPAADILPGHARTWDAGLAEVPTGALPDLQRRGAALRDWLAAIRRLGFARVTGMAPEPGGLFHIVDLFGHVRETNYGRHFEVRTEVNPVNLAFTGLGLQAHTDNPYRDPVPTLQVLACLENSALGGENMLVDGFAAALRLRDEDPGGFTLLCGHSARFEYAGEPGVRLQSRRPMIECSPEGTLIAVRFNSRSVAPLTDVPFDDMQAYYAAYRRFSQIIDDSAMEVTFRQSPGEAVIFDNTRILHARKGYSGEGSRWLQGCYADRDGLMSTLAAMEAGG